KNALSRPCLFHTNWFFTCTETIMVMFRGKIEHQPIRFTNKVKNMVSLHHAQLQGRFKHGCPETLYLEFICVHYKLALQVFLTSSVQGQNRDFRMQGQKFRQSPF